MVRVTISHGSSETTIKDPYHVSRRGSDRVFVWYEKGQDGEREYFENAEIVQVE